MNVNLIFKKSSFPRNTISCWTGFCFLFNLLLISSLPAWASNGTEGASFLDIPVGAAPAALGSAYTARATDAYAPVWNPAGLGFVNAVDISGTHLAYLQAINYEYLGFAVPLGGSSDPDFSLNNHRGLGASVQYIGSGNILGADDQGNLTGSFSTTFAAYSLAYGQLLTDRWSMGLTGKAITESIDGTSAGAEAADIGTMYKVNDQISLAAVVANIGSSVKFVDQSDSLPLAYRVGAYAQLLDDLDASAEGVYHKTGSFTGSAGVQWKYENILAVRFGLDNSHSQGLSSLSLITAGVGIHLFGQELSYAWVPYSDLGNTNYFSLDIRFGGASETRKPGLIKTEDSELPPEPSNESSNSKQPGVSNDYQLLQGMLSDSEKNTLPTSNDSSKPQEQP